MDKTKSEERNLFYNVPCGRPEYIYRNQFMLIIFVSRWNKFQSGYTHSVCIIICHQIRFGELQNYHYLVCSQKYLIKVQNIIMTKPIPSIRKYRQFSNSPRKQNFQLHILVRKIIETCLSLLIIMSASIFMRMRDTLIAFFACYFE